MSLEKQWGPMKPILIAKSGQIDAQNTHLWDINY
jgi:hypothetical protein